VRQLFGELNREMGRRDLLLARVALYAEELPEARALLARIRERIIQARAAGIAEVDFAGSDQFLLEMLELSVRNADEGEWEAFEARWRGGQAAPDEEVEALESRARCALRNNSREQARQHFERALELSELKPNLLGERVKREYSRHFAS
jgi:hypothetical protein